VIQRDVDATLLPQTYDVEVTEWTFVPTSSKTPDTPAYYIARVGVRSRAGEAWEDAIIPMHELRPSDRAALEELAHKTIYAATLKAKARLEASLARSAAVAIKRHSLRRVAPRVR
jgi:hypothetical protein